MWGRFALFENNREPLAPLGDVSDPPHLERYTITPGQGIVVIRRAVNRDAWIRSTEVSCRW